MAEMGLAGIIEEQGRKPSWIARKLGVSPSTVTLWHQGKREIPAARVKQLAELLGVSQEAVRGEPLAGPGAPKAAPPVSEAPAPARARPRAKGAA